MASDLSTEDAAKMAHALQHKQSERVLLKVGDSSTAVAELQRELGIADDGQFGPHTRAAVKAFQRRHGLKPTGKVDVKTWLKLFPTDMIVYAPPGSTSALGVNDTNHAEWAAVSTAASKNESGVAKLGHAAAARAAAHGHGKSDPGLPGVHAASMGATGPAVGIPNVPSTGGPGLGIPGLHGGALAPNGGGGGGGGGPFHFPSLGSFGSAKEMIRAMIRMANRIDSRHYAYRWGGGHNSSFSGPYDCSGAVSAVLHAAGLLSSPRVSGDFMHWGAPGRGAVTIYANAGHVYMSILGRFFGTSGANPGGGAGWFPGGARSGFAVVHVPFSKLHFKSHKKKRHKKKVRRHKKKAHTQKPKSQESGPLNQPETTPPPNSGGSRAPSSGGSQPTTTTANQAPQPAATPNQQAAQPAPAAQQQQSAPPAQPVVNAPQAPQAAQPVTGTGGPVGTTTPNPVQVPQAPAAPTSPTPTVRAPQTSAPQAPKPPAAQPNQQAQQPPAQQQQQSRPQQPATAAPQAVQHAAEQVTQAPASQPPKPPAGSGQGSTPNSGN